jgi:dTDP-4-amino-4,6-dideoxygalactose transaminase
MKIPFADLTSQINSQILLAINRVVKSGQYVGGNEVEKFEEEWAEYCGTDYCVSCGNGFDAIQLVLRTYDFHSYVGVSSYTCLPTWLAVEAIGFFPIETFTDRINIGVHLYGIPSMPSGECDIYIEDAAQAHGMEYKGKKAPLFGIAATWSFYPTKNLGALGDAGAITTNDKALADELKLLRSYKAVNAINSRMDSLQAAILSEKLKYLDEWNDIRRKNAKYYLENLEGVVLPIIPEGSNPCWHQFAIRHPERDRLKMYLQGKGIETMIHYPEPPYRFWSYKVPEVEAWCRETLSLPIAPHLDIEQIEYVAEAVNDY